MEWSESKAHHHVPTFLERKMVTASILLLSKITGTAKNADLKMPTHVKLTNRTKTMFDMMSTKCDFVKIKK